MSADTDLKLAYHMGYDDALAKRKPDASKVQVLAPYDLATENAKLREEIEAAKHDLQVFSMSSVQLDADNAKLRELLREMYEDQCCDGDQWKYRDRMRELGVEVDE